MALSDDYQTVVIHLEIVSYVGSGDGEEQFRETYFVNVHCHHAYFCFYKHDLVVEGGYFGLDGCPILNVEESYYFTVDNENG
jgi:hypothetical protein